MYLSDQGAAVIKVEPPGGDPTRAWNGSPVWNRGKHSLTLDLHKPEGLEVLQRLARDADVLIESSTPDAMQRLGFDYETAHALNPRLIYCSITGYPRRSLDAQRPAHDALVQARTGIQWEQPSYRRTPDGEYREGEPVFLYMPLPTYGAMFLAVTGIETALFLREQTGRGQWVETSLAQGTLLWTTMGMRMRVEQEPPGFFLVSRDARGTVYECGDGKWVHYMPLADSDAQLDRILSMPADVPAPSREDRTAGRVSPEYMQKRQQALQAAFGNGPPRDAFLEQAWAVKIPVVPVQSTSEAYRMPQILHNHMVVAVDDPELGPTRQMGIPYTLTKNPTEVQGPQPRVGEHTDTILHSSGYDAGAIAALRASGVV